MSDDSRNSSHAGTALRLTSVFLAIGAIWGFRQREPDFLQVSSVSYLNHELSYQLASLAVVFVLLVTLALLSRAELLRYARLGDIDAPVTPEPRIGLEPDENEAWKQVGATFTVVITGVTALVVGLTQFSAASFDPELLGYLPWIVSFAAINALVEESIFRLGIVVALARRLSPSRIALASGVVFGGVHYFGVAPRGIAGLVLAGFIGWFLAKSVLETRGLFWAWTIHFVQDLVLFTFIVATRL